MKEWLTDESVCQAVWLKMLKQQNDVQAACVKKNNL